MAVSPAPAVLVRLSISIPNSSHLCQTMLTRPIIRPHLESVSVLGPMGLAKVLIELGTSCHSCEPHPVGIATWPAFVTSSRYQYHAHKVSIFVLLQAQSFLEPF